MRCSICMSQLIEKDDAVICPNCQSIHGAAAITAYQSDFDDNIEKPDSFTKTILRTMLWGVSILFLVTLGGVGGWTLRGNITSFEDVSLLRVASTVLDNSKISERADQSVSLDPGEVSFDEFLFAPHPDQNALSIVGVTPADGTYLIKADASGSAVSAILLETDDRYSPTAAAQFADGALALFGSADNRLMLQAWSGDGALLWRTVLDPNFDPSGLTKLHALGSGLVLVGRNSLSDQTVAHKYSRDGKLEWIANLGNSAVDHLSLYGSTFDELIVLTQDSSTPSSLRVQSLTLSGLSGFSTDFPLQENEQILAATVDPIGQIQILLSGAPPRLLTQDALGRTSQSRTLGALHAISNQAPCLLESQSEHLRVVCKQNDILRESILNVAVAEPEMDTRSATPLEAQMTLVAMYDDAVIVAYGAEGGTYRARAIGLNAIPKLGDVSIPEDGTPGFP